MYKYYIKVTRVIDGDSIVADIDLGFHLHLNRHIRLMDIDAPEVRTKDLAEKARGLECKARLIELLDYVDNHAELVSHGIDKYGRVLGYIIVKSHRETLNDILVAEGLAKTYE